MSGTTKGNKMLWNRKVKRGNITEDIRLNIKMKENTGNYLLIKKKKEIKDVDSAGLFIITLFPFFFYFIMLNTLIVDNLSEN